MAPTGKPHPPNSKEENSSPPSQETFLPSLPPLMTTGFHSSILGKTVTFTKSQGGGLLVVKVFLLSPTPRIMAFGITNGVETPTSLFLDEVHSFILTAQQLIKVSNVNVSNPN